MTASLIETCKLNAVNPHAWLTETLSRFVGGWPQSRIGELMPWAHGKAEIRLSRRQCASGEPLTLAHACRILLKMAAQAYMRSGARQPHATKTMVAGLSRAIRG